MTLDSACGALRAEPSAGKASNLVSTRHSDIALPVAWSATLASGPQPPVNHCWVSRYRMLSC